MSEFERWLECYRGQAVIHDAWQEATKRKAAEINHLQTIIENLGESVRSFTDGNVDLVARERERIVGIVDEYIKICANVPSVVFLKEIKDRIEKDSK